MGSLKDEMRGLTENHQTYEKTDDGEGPVGSNGSNTVSERPEINTSQESATGEDCQPKLHMNASYVENSETNPKSKDQLLSGEDCDTDLTQVKDCIQVDAILTEQAEADEITIVLPSVVTTSTKFVSDGEGNTETQMRMSNNKSLGQDTEKPAESFVVPVSSTPDPFHPWSPDPRSPAPFGQHHVRTQVSLEVVQCHSAATSPMTPPDGGNSFFFPSSFGRSGGVGSDSKDAELQVGQQVEFCSVATSPMTPKTPSTTAFPLLAGKETVWKEEKMKRSEEQKESRQQESCPSKISPTEAGSEQIGSTRCPVALLLDSQVTVEHSNQQCTQQRMGSMDQDITILVTHYGNNEDGGQEKAESSFYSLEPEMVKIDEYQELKEDISTETAHRDQAQNYTNPPQNKTEESSVSACEQSMRSIKSDNSEIKENTNDCEEFKDVTKPPVPESPAPFGCHNIRTQVSLEVVQCQSVATSPMTPPEGDQAFYFPSSLGRCGTVSSETKDAELQVGQQVEFRSVATAPMTPRTPITTTFPEIIKEVNIDEKIVEEADDKKEHAEEEKAEVLKEEEKLSDKKNEEAVEEDIKEGIVISKEKGEDKCEEPVQEVNWDEKGMTWEVYGAVVEVSVLGSAIQKHLEKQVMKQKRQPSMPPPPPLTPSATRLASESTQGGSGSGKGQAGKRGERDGKVRRRRRNPFRLLMENMQQPHCCSRAHTTE